MAELKEVLMYMGALAVIAWLGYVLYLMGSAIYYSVQNHKGWKKRVEEDILDGLYAKYLKMLELKEGSEVIPEVERGAEIWRENVNRDAVWLRVADLFIGHGATEHNEIVKAALERIAEVPKAEVAYEDVVEYCKKRCLTVITNELYEELKRR